MCVYLYGGTLRLARGLGEVFKMGTEPTKTRRRLRADSIRNRELLLAAATEIFGGGGKQASLEAIARKAGVGIATLYRHFPAREDLFEAVYRHEVDHLGTLAEELAQEAEPLEALRKWMHASVRLMATKKGMVDALQLATYGSSELKAYSSARMAGGIGLLLERGVAAGTIRDDVSAEDLLRAVVGIFYAQGTADWQPTALRLVDVLIDGLRKR